MIILSIETSCDDTGVAVVETKGSKIAVLSNVVSSQIKIHKKYGGVFPMMAKREHQNNLLTVFKKALDESKLLISNSKFLISNKIPKSKLKIIKTILEKEPELYVQMIEFLQKYHRPKVDMIAVTHGPGLEPCLWVGVNFARALSYFWDIPLVPVNHIESHILVNFLDNKKIKFPAVCLVASGGHTQLVLMKKIGQYEIIGETRDDAAGECFDKAAKMLGLGYPGGPIISKIASEVKKSSINLPRPMINSKDYDFSFSGLKTAVLCKVKDSMINKSFVEEMCFEVQQAIINVLTKKTIDAAKNYKVKNIILGGGVCANNKLRSSFKKQSPVPVIFPSPKLSTDNALMIAVAGFFHKNEKISRQKLKANANLRIGK